MAYLAKLVLGILVAFISGGWLWRGVFFAYSILVVAGSAATTTSPGRRILTDLGFPEISAWQFGFFAAAVGVLFFATKISLYETPRLILVGLILHADGNGGFNIRAKIKNISFGNAETIMARLVAIRPIPSTTDQSLSLPLTLPTQQRLERRIQSGTEIPSRRFSIMAGEDKNIELFKLFSVTGEVQFFHENGTAEISPESCYLDFTISGFGSSLNFSVWIKLTSEGFRFLLLKDYLDELKLEQASSTEWFEYC